MIKKIAILLICLLFSTTVFVAGTGDGAGATEGTWKDATAQFRDK